MEYKQRREEISYQSFLNDFNIFKCHKNILQCTKYKIDKNFDINKIWTEKNVNMRNKYLNLISENIDFNICYDKVKHLLNENTNRNKSWLEKYHKLFYSIKNNGYKLELVKYGSSYPTCLRFPDNTIYRLDGSHRCSVMKHLDYKYITVKIYEFNEIIEDIIELKDIYKKYIVKTNPNYQLNYKITRKYNELVDSTIKYIKNKNVVDVGCNAGYFTYCLGKTDCNNVTGIDISENNIEYCKLFNENKNKINFFLGCISEYDNINNFDIFYFLRSIYHIGQTIELIINKLDSGKIFIIECNKAHARKFKDPDIIYNGDEKNFSYKRLTLDYNVISFLKNRNFEILETFKNYDNCIIARKI